MDQRTYTLPGAVITAQVAAVQSADITPTSEFSCSKNEMAAISTVQVYTFTDGLCYEWTNHSNTNSTLARDMHVSIYIYMVVTNIRS